MAVKLISKVKYYSSKRLFLRNKLQNVFTILYVQYMEEDIQNYSPTVMFNGTPCFVRFVVLSILSGEMNQEG